MGRHLQTALLAAVLAIAATAGHGAERGYVAPRTPSGAPDLQGVWTNTTLTPFERMPAFSGLTVGPEQAAALEKSLPDAFRSAEIDDVGGRQSEWWEVGAALTRIGGEIRSSWIVEPGDGRIPYAAGVRQRFTDAMSVFTQAFDNPEDRPASERCLMAGPSAGPPMMAANYNSHYRIVQTADHVAVQMELNPEPRIIRLKDTRRLPPQIRPWMGDSVGRWEGETLVVETTNLNPAESIKGPYNVYIGAEARVTERFTRIAADQILYQFSVVDPAAYSAPWRGEAILRPAGGPIYEFACHEGNYSLSGILEGARQAEAAAPRQAAR
jgi:hypothetical protein